MLRQSADSSATNGEERERGRGKEEREIGRQKQTERERDKERKTREKEVPLIGAPDRAESWLSHTLTGGPRQIWNR